VDLKKISLLALLLLFILSGGLFIELFSDSVLVSGAVGNSWTPMAPMNQARGHLGVVALDDKIYAIGGSLTFFASKDSTVDTNECYDPSSNTWVTLTSMPTPRTDFAIAACDGKIYCIGGYTYDKTGMQVFSVVNEVYDIASDSWSTKAAFPVSKAGLSAQAAEGQIFVLGADDNTLFVYNPASDVWTEKNSRPIFDSNLVPVLVDDRLMSVGLFCNTTDDDVVTSEYKVLLIDGSREGKAEPALSKSAFVAGVSLRRVYIFLADEQNEGTLAYETTGSNTWTKGVAMPTRRTYSGVGVVNDIFYVIGGFDATDRAPLDVNEQYMPIGHRDTVVVYRSGSPLGNLFLVAMWIRVAVVVVVAVSLPFFLKNKEKQKEQNQ